MDDPDRLEPLAPIARTLGNIRPAGHVSGP
jgi:hypothetical protein